MPWLIFLLHSRCSSEESGFPSFSVYGQQFELWPLPFLLALLVINHYIGHAITVHKSCRYDVARVERIIDVRPSPTLYRAFSRQLRDKAARWLRHMDRGAQLEIEATFGAMPPEEDPATQGPDGPAWLWWILAILPLASDLKVGPLHCTIKK